MVNTRVGFKKLCVVGEDGQLVADQTHDVDNGVHGLDEVAREVDEQLDGTPDQGQDIGFCLHKDANDLAVFVEPIEECPDLTQVSKCLALSLVFLKSLRRLVDLFDGRDLVDFGLERQVLELAVNSLLLDSRAAPIGSWAGEARGSAATAAILGLGGR